MNLLKLFMQLNAIVTHVLLLFYFRINEKIINDLKRILDKGSELKRRWFNKSSVNYLLNILIHKIILNINDSKVKLLISVSFAMKWMLLFEKVMLSTKCDAIAINEWKKDYKLRTVR
jgi:hypothetical protein